MQWHTCSTPMIKRMLVVERKRYNRSNSLRTQERARRALRQMERVLEERALCNR